MIYMYCLLPGIIATYCQEGEDGMSFYVVLTALYILDNPLPIIPAILTHLLIQSAECRSYAYLNNVMLTLLYILVPPRLSKPDPSTKYQE